MKKLQLCLLLLCVFMVSGCATYKMIEAPPRVSQKSTVEFSDKAPSGATDLPIGVYKVPESRVVISGDFKGGMTGLFFGLAGVLVQDAANKSSAKKTVQDVESHLKWDLKEDLVEISKKILNSGSRFGLLSLDGQQSEHRFVIESYLLLDHVMDVGVIPYIFLKTTKFEEKSRVWRARYIANAGKAKPLYGEGCWIVGDDNSELRKGAKIAMTKVLTVFYNDVIDPYLRTGDKSAMIKLNAQYPYLNKRTQLPGWIVMENEEQMIFGPRIGDLMVFSGINVFSKDEVEVVE